jgi:hypothetical protein
MQALRRLERVMFSDEAGLQEQNLKSGGSWEGYGAK